MNKTKRLNHRIAQIVTETLNREMIQTEIIDILPKLSTYNLNLLMSFAKGLSKNGYQSL
ncbi:MAG: hypothetical protein ACM3XR_02175 [Bacillota bacterium]